MSSTVVNLPKNFQDAKLLMDLIVNPSLELIRAELKTHTDQMAKTASQMGAVVASFDGRVGKLEKDQKRALLGWSVYASAAAGVIAYSYNWLRTHIRVG